ncbi:MAG: NIF family HAD-type phosphatase [Lentimicrobium sp.]
MNPEPLLILDLDETLIFSTPGMDGGAFDFRIPGYHVLKRPGLDAFLQLAAKHFRLAVWSSATEDYVAEIVRALFPPEIPPAFVWGRKRTSLRNILDKETGENEGFPYPVFVKRLKKVKKLGYSLERTLIVDDKPAGLRENFGNIVIVHEFRGDREDRELFRLGKYLVKIKDVPNFRKLEKRNWQMEIVDNE